MEVKRLEYSCSVYYLEIFIWEDVEGHGGTETSHMRGPKDNYFPGKPTFIPNAGAMMEFCLFQQLMVNHSALI